MKKIELYKQLEMEGFFWGDSFEYDIANQIISHEGEVLELLDRICLTENLKPLNGEWNKLTFEDCNKLLMDALRFDLAFMTSEHMPKEKAEYFHEQILNRISTDACRCYTNWFRNPWEDRNGASWNSITQNTFDMAIVFLDNKKLLFTYFISED
jgi:hypothetical protein